MAQTNAHEKAASIQSDQPEQGNELRDSAKVERPTGLRLALIIFGLCLSLLCISLVGYLTVPAPPQTASDSRGFLPGSDHRRYRHSQDHLRLQLS